MKKAIAMIMALTMTFSLYSCGSTDGDSSSGEKSAQTEEASAGGTSEGETEEDTTEEETEKPTKEKKTTEATTEEETEEETESTTTKKTTKKIKTPDLPAGNAKKSDIIGTWKVSEEMFGGFFGSDDGDDSEWAGKLENLYITFTEDDRMLVKFRMDFSEYMVLTDEGLSMDGFTLTNQEYDGTTLKYSMKTSKGEREIAFTRPDGAVPDDIYGEYEWDEISKDRNDEWKAYIEFVDSRTTYIVGKGEGEYQFNDGYLDAEFGADDDFDGGVPVNVSGDSIIITNKDGEEVEFVRAD